MIQITESAQSKIKEVLEDESPETALRMYVTGGGCSGFQYGFSMEEGMNDDDFEIPAGSTNVLVDSLSMQYLENAVVDFKDDLQGSRFSISNPMAQTTCGCGSSFSPY
jgi:iron-sulfur cluster insertion protein|tara:strand:+ start:3411 stop:3734 length:324 start_codon:yes stop_codon:yes gene_type:complete